LDKNLLMLRRTFKINRCICWILLVIIISFSSYQLFHTLYSYSNQGYLSDDIFLGVNKCPACYGQSLCHKFYSGNVTLQGYSRYRFLDSVNTKNVLFGQLDGAIDIVIKRLASDYELKRFDDQFCKKAGESAGCDVSAAAYGSFQGQDRAQLQLEQLQGLSDMMVCPSQRLLDLSVEHYQESRLDGRRLSREGRAQFIMTATVNPEPLLIQAFASNWRESWPFPQYLGACGRFIVETFEGTTLQSALSETWEIRVDVSLQLLRIADHLSQSQLGFAFYLTDVSMDNFAINNDGKVIIIDLENIIIVDQSKVKRDKPAGWDDVVSGALPCTGKSAGCVAFSTEDLCSHYTSDHNYYSICNTLLYKHHDGLLSDLPTHVDQQWNISSLVHACSDSTAKNDRTHQARKLIENLAQLRKDVF